MEANVKRIEKQKQIPSQLVSVEHSNEAVRKKNISLKREKQFKLKITWLFDNNIKLVLKEFLHEKR